MIPTIIYLLLRKYRRTNPEAAQKIQAAMNKISKTVALIILFLAAAQLSISQERKLDYVIKRKGNEVGNLSFTQLLSGNKVFFKMESEVRTRMLFLFTAKAKEESLYEDGIMTWSSIYRKMNGSEKANKKTRLTGNNYTISKEDGAEIVNNYPIRYNMLCLYTQEPTSITQVYSDNFQRFVEIKTIAPHHYKIKFPDGNSSEYFYSSGICFKVKINHSLYSASIELKS